MRAGKIIIVPAQRGSQPNFISHNYFERAVCLAEGIFGMKGKLIFAFLAQLARDSTGGGVELQARREAIRRKLHWAVACGWYGKLKG